MTGRLSRSERRALQREDALVLPLPLTLGSDPRPVAAHVRHIIRLLRNPQADSPCSDAMAHVTGLFDRTVPAPPAPLACRKGCCHCCTQMVVLTAPEAFFVAAQIRRRSKSVAAVREAHAQTQGLSLHERLRSGVMCPLLEDAICSIYPARPLGCHAFVSTELNACLAAFVRGETPNIPMPADYVSVLQLCRMFLLAALRLSGRPAATYEMNHALTALLGQDNAEARWLAGEDVLADVPAAAPPPPQYAEAIAKLAAFVAPTL